MVNCGFAPEHHYRVEMDSPRPAQWSSETMTIGSGRPGNEFLIGERNKRSAVTLGVKVTAGNLQACRQSISLYVTPILG